MMTAQSPSPVPDEGDPTSSLDLVGRRDLGGRVRAFTGSTASVWNLATITDQLVLAASEVTAAAWCHARLPLRLELVHRVRAREVVVACSGARRADPHRPTMPAEWGAADARAVLALLGLEVEVEDVDGDVIRARVTVPCRGSP